MQGRPSCLLQSAIGEANRILLASVQGKLARLDYSSEFGLLR